jgi:hypothetical protein
MSLIRHRLKPFLFGALALSNLALAPFAFAAEYCVGTVSPLQNALNQAETDGQGSKIRIRSGNDAVTGIVRSRTPAMLALRWMKPRSPLGNPGWATRVRPTW